MESIVFGFKKTTDLLWNKSVIHIGPESMISGTASRGGQLPLRIMVQAEEKPKASDPSH